MMRSTAVNNPQSLESNGIIIKTPSAQQQQRQSQLTSREHSSLHWAVSKSLSRSGIRSRRPPPPTPALSDTDSDGDYERERRFRIFTPPLERGITEFLLDEDLFCPDLLRNCKSLAVIDDDQDYIEISELVSKLNLHNEIGLPTAAAESLKISTKSEVEMGQAVSLRKPKISMTWVLREQQNQQGRTPRNIDWNKGSGDEKILFRRDLESKETLLSEKYISDNDLIDFKHSASRRDNVSGSKPKIKERCCGHRYSPDYDQIKPTLTIIDNNDKKFGLKKRSLSQTLLSSSKSSTYSDPSIYITSAQSDTGAMTKRRKRKKRSKRVGYNIQNVDEFLSKCSLSCPANIPVVLSNASILYQTRTGYNQIEVPVPLGMIVNSIFKNQNWLYVQTPHGEEGYVNYNSCMPLGIISNPARSTSSPIKPKPWETNNDVFPSVNGNYTDSEKEHQIRGCKNWIERRKNSKFHKSNRSYSEKYLDSLYLRAASQPKIIDQSYAQLKSTDKCKLNNFNNFDKINGDYVQLKYNEEKFNFSSKTKRQVLLAITENFSSDMIQVRKGEVVSLLACKEYQNLDKFQQWFFIRCRDGSEGYIPSHVTDEFL